MDPPLKDFSETNPSVMVAFLLLVIIFHHLSAISASFPKLEYGEIRPSEHLFMEHLFRSGLQFDTVESYRAIFTHVNCPTILKEETTIHKGVGKKDAGTAGGGKKEAEHALLFPNIKRFEKGRKLKKAELIFGISYKKGNDKVQKKNINIGTGFCVAPSDLINFFPTITVLEGGRVLMRFDITNILDSEHIFERHNILNSNITELKLKIPHQKDLAFYSDPFFVVYSEPKQSQNKSKKQEKVSPSSFGKERTTTDRNRVKREVRAYSSVYTYVPPGSSANPGKNGKNDAFADRSKIMIPGNYFQYGMASSAQENRESAMNIDEVEMEKSPDRIFEHQHRNNPSSTVGGRIAHPRRRKFNFVKGGKYSPTERKEVDPMFGFGREPWFGKRRHKPRHLRPPMEKGKEKNQSAFAPMWDMRTQKTSGKVTEEIKSEGYWNQTDQQKCARKSLFVNFRDIGWGHRIIAPESFDAGFCTGSCQFPLNTKKATNHAIVLSLLQKANGKQQKNHKREIDLPETALCCAPDQMDSITLLYFDDNENVVLKTFPKMSVISCSCK